MKEWLDEFLREFQKNHLKELGFKKVRRTFSRDLGDYWERFNFQGSSWNSSDEETWLYYINLGVEFKDIEPRKYWSYFPHTHWSGRIESVVGAASVVGQYDENTNKEELAKNLKRYILEASGKMLAEIKGLRQYYLEGRHLEQYPFKD